MVSTDFEQVLDPVLLDERGAEKALDGGVEAGRVVVGDHVGRVGQDTELGVRQVMVDFVGDGG